MRRQARLILWTLAAPLAVLLCTSASEAQAPRWVYLQPPVYYQQARPVVYVQRPIAPVQSVPVQSSDPSGFTAWLNGQRAQYGLPAVGYDANLEAWAQQNNQQQQARGIGHYVMGPARRQNSAMGPYASIGAMWLSSPLHRAALLDPSITRIGLAGLGAWWTFNAN